MGTVKDHAHAIDTHRLQSKAGIGEEARQVKARSRQKLLMKQVNFMYSNLAAINSSNSANALWAVLIVAAAHGHYFLQICDVSRVIRCTRPSSPLTFNYHFCPPTLY